LTVGLFGRLPQEGEEIVAGDVRLRIDRTRGRRILSLHIYRNGTTASGVANGGVFEGSTSGAGPA